MTTNIAQSALTIYRCNHCTRVENHTGVAGEKVACAHCGTLSTIYEASFFIEKLAERYFAALQEIESLKAAQLVGEGEISSEIAAEPAPTRTSIIDLHNTEALATLVQHQPLQNWFVGQKIQAEFDISQVDTRGFFDDAAQLVGEKYELCSTLMARIRSAYQRDYSSVTLKLGDLSQKTGQALNDLCRQLYSHTFFARFYYLKPEKTIRLILQPELRIRNFFGGIWLEWYAFMLCLKHFEDKKQLFSCARSVKLTFQNEDLHEMDVVFLPAQHSPLFIECKSGEFRQDIQKYQRLRQRLKADTNHFVLCVSDLSDQEAVALSVTYALTFVNLRLLPIHLKKFF